MPLAHVFSILLLVGGFTLIGAVAKHFGVDRASRRRDARPPAEAPAEDVAAMHQLIGRMEDRIATLERILDADDPKWRTRL